MIFFSVNYDLRYKRNPRALLEFLGESHCVLVLRNGSSMSHLPYIRRRQNLRRYFHFLPTFKKLLVHIYLYCTDQSPPNNVLWWALFRKQILRFELVGPHTRSCRLWISLFYIIADSCVSLILFKIATLSRPKCAL